MLTIRFDRLGVRPGDLVLDAGAGFGRHAFALARAGADVVALDYADDEVAATRATFGAMIDAGEIDPARYVGALRGDATRLPFTDATFDRVITSEVLEHVQDDVDALAELQRVLRPGGTFAATVPTEWPEKINWRLSDEYHAPKSVGGHVRIYSATELKAKLRSAGLDVSASHHAHALHSPYWWLKCAVGPRRTDSTAVNTYRKVLEWEIVEQPRSMRVVERACSPVLGKSFVVYAHKPASAHARGRRRSSRWQMTSVPDLPGVLSAAEVRATADWIAGLQLPSGMIPWFPGGHCDPWNHVETAMALDVAGLHEAAAHAYRWLADIQRPDGSWWNYYLPDGSVEEAKLDTNVCAYVATGLWHHWLCTRDRAFLDELWPTACGALEWVLSMRRRDGTVLWARNADDSPWDYALLAGSASIAHALRCGAQLARVTGERQRRWTVAADAIADRVANAPDAFEPKDRWAMDWYYPVLTATLTGEPAKARLTEGWELFATEGRGIRCVSDEAWITASETAECSIAYSVIDDRSTATDLLAWTRSHRRADGAYWTGVVYPSEEHFPLDEVSAYTGAAVVLAADAITAASPASGVFVPR